MPLIESDPKGKKVSLTIELDRKTNAMLKKYIRFSGADTEKVVAGALRRLFDQEKDFGPWLEQHGNSGKKSPSPGAPANPSSGAPDTE